MERFICIHGHFYQPPRENPWLEAIEVQDSAYPYHDWNERITAECYAPNARSRILDGSGRIERIVNNYKRISFNFGPTLLSWMQDRAPEAYQAILEADRESQQLFSGHGSALAQAYNHVILPLANARDIQTQVKWGIADFEHRFGRYPEGMWLPETAVHLEGLEALAEHSIRFTLLAPSQASRIRPRGTKDWQDVSGGRIDPTMPYTLNLPSGRSIVLFFYDGPISRAVAFERLLTRGEYLAHRLMGAFSDKRGRPQLVHIATDGETYGHHHPQGDMALAYALHYIEDQELAQLTNYGEFLERFPPTHEVEIFENTAWSCAHGVGRWRQNCGCNGGHPGWEQTWRAPLRDALDWLRDEVSLRFEVKGAELLKDPWLARDRYISVILDRSTQNIETFLEENTRDRRVPGSDSAVLKLLELQRAAMLMYTSCGWFFDDLSGIETVQVMQYAGRVVQLAGELFGCNLEPEFERRLEQARSNVPQHRDGRHIYERMVKPAMVDLVKVGGHFALSSLFEEYPVRTRIYRYLIETGDYHRLEAGITRLAIGHCRVTSEITRESAEVSFGVLHLGEHSLLGGVRLYGGDAAYQSMLREVKTRFDQVDFPEVIRQMSRYFGDLPFSLRTLFRDEQRTIIGRILDATLEQDDGIYRQLYDRQVPLMRFLSDLSAPLPRAFYTAAGFVLNVDLRRAFEEEEPKLERIRDLLDRAMAWHITLDTVGLAYVLQQRIEQLMERLKARPDGIAQLQMLEGIVSLAREMPFRINYWQAQNAYYALLQSTWREMEGRAARGDAAAGEWSHHFKRLGELLSVRVDTASATSPPRQDASDQA